MPDLHAWPEHVTLHAALRVRNYSIRTQSIRCQQTYHTSTKHTCMNSRSYGDSCSYSEQLQLQ